MPEETLKDLAEESVSKKGRNKEEEVSIKSSELKGLIATVAKLQQDLDTFKKGGAVELPTVKLRKARVHFYNGKAITSVGQAWEINDKYGEPEMRLEIFVGEKKYDVKYRDFMESNEKAGFTSEECTIKEIKTIDDGEQILGYVNKIDVQYDSFRSEVIGQVPLKVTIPVYEYIMLVGDEEVAVNPLALN